MPDAIPGFDGKLLKDAAGAILFMQSATTTLDAYSTFMSSPWTTEKFGQDEESAQKAMEYVAHATGWSLFLAVIAARLAESWWPIIGSVIANIYLIWLYRRALSRGKKPNAVGS